MRTMSGLVVGCALAVGAGCSQHGGGPVNAESSVLYEVADMMRATTKPDGKGPTGVGSFAALQSVYPRGYQAVKSGEVVVIWGAGVKGEGEAAKGGEVVAYEKDAPTNGGYVLLTSGEVKKMSASEFASAPKAAGKK